MKLAECILFDFDGTVYDTVEGITRSVRYAINKHGLDAELEDHTDCRHETVRFEETAAASCTEEGSGTYVCEDCGKTLFTVTLPAAEHSYEYASDQDGHWQVCSVCGERTDAAAHAMSNGVCAECGYGCTHSYEDRVAAPTCTARGYTVHTCSLCGHVVTDTYTKALGHDYACTIVKEPTCEMEGDAEFVCKRCGAKTNESVPAAGHHAVVDPAVEATCRDTGLTQGMHCDVCGAVLEEQETIPARDHLFLGGVCVWCGEAAPEGYTYSGGDNKLPEIPL